MDEIMKTRGMNWRASRLIVAVAVLAAMAAGSVQAQHSMGGNLVSDWNMTCMMMTPTLGTHRGIRALATMHTAIYDATIAFGDTHTPYYVTNRPPAGASQRAAASAAAYEVLYTVFTNPAQRQTSLTLYTNQLAMIPDEGKASGIAFGQSVAQAIMMLRSTDGAMAAMSVPHPDGTLPGEWRRTSSGEPMAPGWGSVTPWAMTSGNQFARSGPPALTSQEYFDNYEETRLWGATNSVLRTPEQSSIVRFWEEHVPAKWTSLARDLAAREDLSLVQSAHLFGLLSVTLADSTISVWDMKYVQNFWRPETAIQLGDSDDNTNTIGDAAWRPFAVTPAFPEYVSGHSLTCASAAKLLELFFGTGNYAFQLSAMGIPGTRSYTNFWQAAEEAGASRIHGGIHFQFSNVDALEAGAELGQYIFNTVMVQTSVPPAHAMGRLIEGVASNTITLTAGDGHISTADGNSLYFWGYGLGTNAAQYPGTTLIVNQGDTVTVTLYNRLSVPASIVFPGQSGVSAVGGAAGLLTQEAPAAVGGVPGGPVTYSFVASEPGTYMYQSGTRPDLQIEMGLVGALIVRPTGFDPMDHMTWKAYSHTNSAFENEYLFLLTEMDENIHDLIELGRIAEVDTANRFPVYWFINGRTGPDTMLAPSVWWLPTQPYNCMPMTHPGQKVLMRMIGGGRDGHPFHHHGNHSDIIARDGRLLESAPGMGADLAQSVFTLQVTPGGTMDSLWSWTGEKIGWDVYGHGPNDPLAPNEYENDHGKPFPTTLPDLQNLTFGQMYSGSPFLGTSGTLPPGEGGFNPNGGFMYMWHSHNEKEICNNNLFPGGMLTMGMVEAYPMTMP